MLTVSKKLGPPEWAIAMAVPPGENLRTPKPPARKNAVRGGSHRHEAVSSRAAGKRGDRRESARPE